ncbi:MAG: hypothetical protein N2440_04370 [Actinobacteria bacterium]|nr:hypothetical protein [Actinomycetota bacterium]
MKFHNACAVLFFVVIIGFSASSSRIAPEAIDMCYCPGGCVVVNTLIGLWSNISSNRLRSNCQQGNDQGNYKLCLLEH